MLGKSPCPEEIPNKVFSAGVGSPFAMAVDKQDGDKKNWVKIANYAELAIVFPAATVVGWLIGAALDRWLHTGWISIVGLILGIAAGFVELVRTVTKSQ